jgi:hypothetical protein
MRGLQKVEMPVDVADGINVHVQVSLERAGGFTPPDLRGIFVQM